MPLYVRPHPQSDRQERSHHDLDGKRQRDSGMVDQCDMPALVDVAQGHNQRAETMTPNGARKLVVYGVVDGHLVKIGQVIWPHTAAGHDIAWRQIATMCLDHPTTLIDIKVLEDVTVGYGHELAARIAQGAHTP
jgi:hypothetical protein